MNIICKSIPLCVCILMSLLAGCILVGPRYHQPDATQDPVPESYQQLPEGKSSVGWQPAKPEDAMLRGKWWTIFKEPELDALEDQLTINNQNIKQFFENFMAARAIVGEANSQLYPTLTANASYTRSLSGSSASRASTVTSTTPATTTSSVATSGSSSVVSVPLAATPVTSIVASLNLSWEPDLWGKVRNTIRQAQYNAQVSNADLENERLSEQASLAMYFFEIRGQDALQKLYNDTVAADRKALDYTRAQFETGVGDKISVLEAENTLRNTQATATNIGIARAQYANAIAVLVGKNPSTFTIPVKVLKASPPPVPTGLPSLLIERRPDIAAAERTMAAANAQIGIEYAAYFPSLTIGGDRGYQDASTFSQLFKFANRFWSIGPSASETIFDAGLRQATIHQFVATYNADLAAYRQSVLTAFQQVENYLAALRLSSQEVIQEQLAEKAAEEYLKLQLARYETGVDPYVNVVTAQNALLSDQQTVINLQVQEMTAAVQLVESLGGGWDKSQLPTPHDVSKWPTHAEAAIQH